MIYHEQYNLHQGDEITHFQNNCLLGCPKNMCKIVRFKAENEKYAKMGVYSETTGEVIIPEEHRESLEIDYIRGDVKENPNGSFIVSKNEKGYEFYNFDGTRFIEGIYKEYLTINSNCCNDWCCLILTNLEGKSIILNEKHEFSDVGWVDKIQERTKVLGFVEKTLEISNNGKKAVTDFEGNILVPFYDDCSQIYEVKYADRNGIFRGFYNFKSFINKIVEEICIIRNGENYGIYSVSKQKEIYPLKAKSIMVKTQVFKDVDVEDKENLSVKVAGGERKITNITIVDHNNMKEHSYDFTSDFEEVVNLYESLNCIFCHTNYDYFGELYLFKILENSDGSFVMTDENGIIEKIGVFDSYEPVISQKSPRFVGFRIHKGNKQSYFSIDYGELVVDFYEKVSVPELIPSSLFRTLYDDVYKCIYEHLCIVSNGKFYGIYSYRSKKEIYPLKFKKVKIEDYRIENGNRIVRFSLIDQLDRNLTYDYTINFKGND